MTKGMFRLIKVVDDENNKFVGFISSSEIKNEDKRTPKIYGLKEEIKEKEKELRRLGYKPLKGYLNYGLISVCKFSRYCIERGWIKNPCPNSCNCKKKVYGKLEWEVHHPKG